jgi:hypothetical protein
LVVNVLVNEELLDVDVFRSLGESIVVDESKGSSVVFEDDSCVSLLRAKGSEAPPDPDGFLDG